MYVNKLIYIYRYVYIYIYISIYIYTRMEGLQSLVLAMKPSICSQTYKSGHKSYCYYACSRQAGERAEGGGFLQLRFRRFFDQTNVHPSTEFIRRGLGPLSYLYTCMFVRVESIYRNMYEDILIYGNNCVIHIYMYMCALVIYIEREI